MKEKPEKADIPNSAKLIKEENEFIIKFRGVRGSYPVAKANFLKFGGNTASVEVRCGEQLIILDAGTGIIDIVDHANIIKDLALKRNLVLIGEEIVNNSYKKSYDLVSILFKDKVDKNNKPYITHLIRVSSKMSTIEGRVAALLHDVVEDINGVTFNDLKDIGIPDNIIEVLKLVTKKEHEKNITKSKKY